VADSVLLAARAFVGDGKLVALVLPSPRARQAITVGHCGAAKHRACTVAVERDAIAQRIAEDPALSRVIPFSDEERWIAGQPAPKTYGPDWVRMTTLQGIAYRNDSVDLLAIPSIFALDAQRHVSLCLTHQSSWSIERIMEGATSFIRRGTRVTVAVEKEHDHLVVVFRHRLEGDIAGGFPLDEEGVEQALQPFWATLASYKVPLEAVRARMKADRRDEDGGDHDRDS
jgi:hypothetical protein